MKKILIFQILFSIIACKSPDPNLDVLEITPSGANRAELINNSLRTLYDLYSKSTKIYSNYEVNNNGRQFAVNWCPKYEILYFQIDACEWGYCFKGINEQKLIELVKVMPLATEPEVDIVRFVLKFAEKTQDKSKLKTNSCTAFFR